MSHDGSASIQAMFTPIRVVCNNTLDAALQLSKNKISIRHTKNAKSRLNEGVRILGLVNQNVNVMKEVYYAMSQFTLTPPELPRK